MWWTALAKGRGVPGTQWSGLWMPHSEGAEGKGSGQAPMILLGWQRTHRQGDQPPQYPSKAHLRSLWHLVYALSWVPSLAC